MCDCATSVKCFGAKGDGIADDTNAIQAAIDIAAGSVTPTICIPPGRYRITRAISPEYDNVTIVGSSGSVLIADPQDGEGFPEAILVNKDRGAGLAAVKGLTLCGFAIEVRNGPRGDTSTGVIPLNNCLDCILRSSPDARHHRAGRRAGWHHDYRSESCRREQLHFPG